MARFWITVFPLVRAELRTWQERAAAIPDPELREQALATIRSERLSAAGAALFAATLDRHEPGLVRALVAFQVTIDYLDTLSEQPTADPIGNGVQLHRALAEAIGREPGHPDYYARHHAREDGGYLAALVDACREGCSRLPSDGRIQAAAAREAERTAVQGMNHAPAPLREPALRRWAEQQGDAGDASWFELAAAGASSLAVLALIAAAAEPTTTTTSAEQVRAAYFPWIEALSTLLDSLVDRERDALTGEMSFIACYPSDATALMRMEQVAARAVAGARKLPRGERHVVLIAGMIAMHLSEPSAWAPATRPMTLALLRASGTAMAPILLPLMRVWRLLRSRGGETDARGVVPEAEREVCALAAGP
ncbi:MAG: putative cytoplasmic protein [Conexibacter sp.]|nr:putative cytoplasmic protein [Conexibacter sp.]